MLGHMCSLWKYVIAQVATKLFSLLSMCLHIVILHCFFWHFCKSTAVSTNHFGSILVVSLHVTPNICDGLSFVLTHGTGFQPFFQMSIFDVSLQCWWCRQGQAALVALVFLLVNSDVIFQQLGAVEVLSTLLAREIFFQGANSFPLKVCLGLRNELGIMTIRSWLMGFGANNTFYWYEEGDISKQHRSYDFWCDFPPWLWCRSWFHKKDRQPPSRQCAASSAPSTWKEG